MPVCSACHECRPLTDFNRSTRRPSGHQSYCRRCSRQKGREYSAVHRSSPAHCQAEVERQNRRYWLSLGYRFKKIARTRAQRALSRGQIQREPCRCGNPEAEMHHEDYAKPLEVRWLCRACWVEQCYGPDLVPASDEDPIAELLRRFDARRALRDWTLSRVA